jgi:hypothetical protein
VPIGPRRELPLPAPVVDALGAWLAAHDEVAPGVVEGLYVVGSAALGDWTPHSDVDVVAVVADPSDPDLFDDLAAAQETVREHVTLAVDGPYVAWGDLVVPPMALQRPWVVGGEYHVDGESFEINPIVWYTLATAGVALRGEPPEALGVYVDDADRRSFVRENVDTYWRGIVDALHAGIDADTTSTEADGAILEWVALGIARMLYTWETGDVVSKSAAGRWAAELPSYPSVFDQAVERRAAPGTVGRDVLVETVDVAAAIVAAITER